MSVPDVPVAPSSLRARIKAGCAIPAVAVLLASCATPAQDSRQTAAASTPVSTAVAPSKDSSSGPRPPSRIPSDTAVPSTSRAETAPPTATAPSMAPPPAEPVPDPGSPTDDRSPTTPPTGHYTYATVGYEELVLTAERHDYPDTTTVSIENDSCGVRAIWRPLETRVNEAVYCPTDNGGSTVREHRSHREFSGRPRSAVLVCAPGTWAVPPRSGPTTWSGRCGDGTDEASIHGQLLDDETVELGGRRETARRLRLDLTLSGSSRGAGRQELWIHPDTNLPLKVVSALDVEVDTPLGPTRYVEHYELLLVRN